MSDAEATEYSVTEFFFESSDLFPVNGANVKIGEEILRYRARGIKISILDGIIPFMELGEPVKFDGLEWWEERATVKQHEMGPETLAIAARGLFADKIGVEQIQLEWVGDGGASNEVPAVPPSVNAFMTEHQVGSHILQVCMCDGSARSDFPQYDVIRVSSPGGAQTLPATVTGGRSGATATAVAYDSTNFLLTVVKTSGEFQVAEGIGDGTWTAVIEEINYGDGTDLPARNNPITALLQLLMSTGDGSNGEFDTLPEGWGLGLDSSFVDVDAIKALRDKYFASTTIDFILHEPIGFRDWAEKNVYRFLQIFPFETLAGKLSLGKLFVEDECRELDDGSLAEFGEDEIKAQGLPDWTSGRPPVTKIVVKYNKHPISDKFYGDLEINFKRARSYYQDRGRVIKIKTAVLYIPNALIRTVDPLDPELPSLLAWMINPMFGRHSIHPAPIMKATGNYAQYSEHEIGDVVKVTHANMPNLRTGTRGLSGEYCQILGIEPNADGDSTDLTLWQVGVHDSRHGLKPPSAVVYAYAADTPGAGKSTITLYQRVYNRYDGGFDRDDFEAADEVMFLTTEYDPIAGASAEEATIESVGTGTDYEVVLDQNLTNPPSKGDIMELATYDNIGSTRQSTRVYMADEDRWLGAGDDSAFKYK